MAHGKDTFTSYWTANVRINFQAEITIDSTTGQVYIEEISTHTKIVLSPATRRSPSVLATKNDKPVSEIFQHASQITRFIIQTFMPRRTNG